MSKFLNALEDATNFGYTENGGLTHRTTKSRLLDMFAFGAAMRKRSDEDVLDLWRDAFAEDPTYALKCLFYIRDVRGGQGERRFFRVCMKDLASHNIEAARRNLRLIPEYGRWDDLYVFVGTPLEDEMFTFMKEQLVLDLECKTPSLLAKWMKSENTSSKESRELANITRQHLNMNHKEYRKVLSTLRERINVLERLMSANEWEKIEFDKIPSKAGLKYKNAFARRDVERVKAGKVTYKDFIEDENTTVNADTLYPYEVVSEVVNNTSYWRAPEDTMDATQRAAINKYWDNLKDYFNGATFNGMAIVDTSGSMVSSDADAPINVAISIGMYCAERAKGPFAGHYISFASRPQLIEIKGKDFCDKVRRIYRTNLCDNTNIEAVFDLVLKTAVSNKLAQEDLPENLIIISDMEFDEATGNGWHYGASDYDDYFGLADTVMETAEKKFNAKGYQMPKLIFWNVNARHDNIPMKDNGRVSFVSGMSPSIFDSVMTGKTGYDLMMDKLDSPRYSAIG